MVKWRKGGKEMDVFQGIGKGIERVFETVKDSKEKVKYKAKRYSSQSKLHFQKMEVEGEIKRLYRELGEVYYDSIEQQTTQSKKLVHELMAQLDEQKEILKGIENQMRQHLFKEKEEEPAKRCPYCNEPLGEKDQFCSHCGYSMEETKDFERGVIVDNIEILTKMCPNCGNQVSIHAKYCNRCGLDLENL